MRMLHKYNLLLSFKNFWFFKFVFYNWKETVQIRQKVETFEARSILIRLPNILSIQI